MTDTTTTSPQRPAGAAATDHGQCAAAPVAVRTYVLDTSVLLSDPWAPLKFAEHTVVLPVVVITELEGKRHHPDLGWFARQALNLLEDLRRAGGRLDRGVPVSPDGGMLRVELNHVDDTVLPAGLRLSASGSRGDSGGSGGSGDNDRRILACALNLRAGAKILAERLTAKDAVEAGVNVLTGGTDVHLVLVDLRHSEMNGQEAEDLLHDVGITVNRNAVPFDPRPPMVTSGLRIGTPALASRGLDAAAFAEVADIIGTALVQGKDADTAALRARVDKLAEQFPLYPGLEDWKLA
jgi:hypothetical protein